MACIRSASTNGDGWCSNGTAAGVRRRTFISTITAKGKASHADDEAQPSDDW